MSAESVVSVASWEPTRPDVLTVSRNRKQDLYSPVALQGFTCYGSALGCREGRVNRVVNEVDCVIVREYG